MIWLWVAPAVAGIGLLVALVKKRTLRAWGREVLAERAREAFALERERLESAFFSAAANQGKPRGLRWKQCTFEPDLEIARERGTGQLVALVPVTIQFEAIEGSDMEGLPAVSNLRNASALFVFQRGQWLTSGKAVFNLNPMEAIEHFRGQYEHVARA
jgi:hypothetical protein